MDAVEALRKKREAMQARRAQAGAAFKATLEAAETVKEEGMKEEEVKVEARSSSTPGVSTTTTTTPTPAATSTTRTTTATTPSLPTDAAAATESATSTPLASSSVRTADTPSTTRAATANNIPSSTAATTTTTSSARPPPTTLTTARAATENTSAESTPIVVAPTNSASTAAPDMPSLERLDSNTSVGSVSSIPSSSPPLPTSVAPVSRLTALSPTLPSATSSPLPTLNGVSYPSGAPAAAAAAAAAVVPLSLHRNASGTSEVSVESDSTGRTTERNNGNGSSSITAPDLSLLLPPIDLKPRKTGQLKRKLEEVMAQRTQYLSDAAPNGTALEQQPSRTGAAVAAHKSYPPPPTAGVVISYPAPPLASLRAAPISSAPLPDSVLNDLLHAPTHLERTSRDSAAEIHSLLSAPTHREHSIKSTFKSATGTSAVMEYCPHRTVKKCKTVHGSVWPCEKTHFRKVILPWTNVATGVCAYTQRSNCRSHRCQAIHYEIDTTPVASRVKMNGGVLSVDPHLPSHSSSSSSTSDHHYSATPTSPHQIAFPAQWINCDVTKFDLSVLGTFDVVMADPPWRISMGLPYQTLSDEQMLSQRWEGLSTDGVLFLWVTYRAMEVARACMKRWGYTIRGELVWLKVNPLQRFIRNAMTGVWLNHAKEHCLIGIKGNPSRINRQVDCDVIVSELRETSRKPDEIYGILERLVPGGRKIEIFGRQHNTRPGWVTLGNQLKGSRLADKALIERYRAAYPREPFEDISDQTSQNRKGQSFKPQANVQAPRS